MGHGNPEAIGVKVGQTPVKILEEIEINVHFDLTAHETQGNTKETQDLVSEL